MFSKISAVVVGTWLGCLALTGAASAQDLTVRWLSPDGKVLDRRELSLSDLDNLKQSTVDTTTPWTKGVQHFTGPSLAEMASLAGRAPVEAKVIALNDYAATVPAEDWQTHGAILSTRLNDQTMRIRDKGPFWVMYPIDKEPELAQQYYQSRMVWQVKSIDFIAR